MAQHRSLTVQSDLTLIKPVLGILRLSLSIMHCSPRKCAITAAYWKRALWCHGYGARFHNTCAGKGSSRLSLTAHLQARGRLSVLVH